MTKIRDKSYLSVLEVEEALDASKNFYGGRMHRDLK